MDVQRRRIYAAAFQLKLTSALFYFISVVLPEKARLDTAGAIKVNLRETCILLSIEFQLKPQHFN
jgi:hypothetical protein